MPNRPGQFDLNEEIEYYSSDSLSPVSADQIAFLAKDMQLWVPQPEHEFEGKDVLDLGAGKGAVGILIGQHFQPRKIVSVELVFQRLSTAKQWSAQMHHYQLVVGNIFTLPFADCSFDCVVANSVLHHLPNLHLATREIQRVLRPGGKYIGREPNFNNPLVRLGVFRLQNTFFFSGSHSNNEYPLRAQEIIAAFKQAGCDCHMEYFWRRLPGLHHPILSVAMSVQAQRT
ncbi:MAG: class I SAM-dependent methyltransferase [Anaerolineae bacterium]